MAGSIDKYQNDVISRASIQMSDFGKFGDLEHVGDGFKDFGNHLGENIHHLGDDALKGMEGVGNIAVENLNYYRNYSTQVIQNQISPSV